MISNIFGLLKLDKQKEYVNENDQSSCIIYFILLCKLYEIYLKSDITYNSLNSQEIKYMNELFDILEPLRRVRDENDIQNKVNIANKGEFKFFRDNDIFMTIYNHSKLNKDIFDNIEQLKCAIYDIYMKSNIIFTQNDIFEYNLLYDVCCKLFGYYAFNNGLIDKHIRKEINLFQNKNPDLENA